MSVRSLLALGAKPAVIAKHLPGEHDQSTHGSWASGHHATSAEAAGQILIEGFDLGEVGGRFGSLWGEGVYLASNFDEARQWQVMMSGIYEMSILQVEVPEDANLFRFEFDPWEAGRPQTLVPQEQTRFLNHLLETRQDDAFEVLDEVYRRWNGSTYTVETTRTGRVEAPTRRWGDVFQEVLEEKGWDGAEIVPATESGPITPNNPFFLPSGGHQVVIWNPDVVSRMRVHEVSRESWFGSLRKGVVYYTVARRAVAKHKGPGDHPSGSSQKEHGKKVTSSSGKKTGTVYDTNLAEAKDPPDRELPDDPEAFARQLFDARLEIDGVTYIAEAPVADIVAGRLVIGGNIRVEDGPTIGMFKRRVDSQYNVYNAEFRIDEEYQGRGIGTMFLSHWEDEMAAAGFKSMTVSAVDTGRYAWAISGYEWDHLQNEWMEGAEDLLRSRESMGDQMPIMNSYHDDDQSWKELEMFVEEWRDVGYLAQPVDFAMIGSNRPRGDSFFGKELMLANGPWGGRKELKVRKGLDEVRAVWKRWATDDPAAVETDDPKFLKELRSVLAGTRVGKHYVHDQKTHGNWAKDLAPPERGERGRFFHGSPVPGLSTIKPSITGVWGRSSGFYEEDPSKALGWGIAQDLWGGQSTFPSEVFIYEVEATPETFERDPWGESSTSWMTDKPLKVIRVWRPEEIPFIAEEWAGTEYVHEHKKPVTKHAAPIHPGTGTDQSVHGSGGGKHTTSVSNSVDWMGAGPGENPNATVERLSFDRANAEIALAWRSLPELEGERTYWIRPHNIKVLENELARLNRRGQRYFGIAEEDGLRLNVLDRTHAHTTNTGTVMAFTAIEIVGQEPNVPGFDFIGKIEHIQNEDGSFTNILKAAPGFEDQIPAEYRDAGPNCDLCKRKIYRRDTFLVRDQETGKVVQLGRDDLQAYTGYDEAEQFANYTSKWSDIMTRLDEGEGGFDDLGGGGGPVAYNQKSLLAITASITRKKGFAPVSAYDRVPTKEWLNTVLTTRNPDDTVKELYPSEQDHEKAEEVYNWLAEMDPSEIPASNSYIWNLRAAVLSPYGAGHNQLGLIASGVSAYDREQGRIIERQAQAAANAESEWIGEVKERRPFLNLKITRHSTSEGFYGTTHWYDFRDENNNLITWPASKPLGRQVPHSGQHAPPGMTEFQPFDVGDTVHLRATIKAHDRDTYKEGSPKQTLIERANLIDENDKLIKHADHDQSTHGNWARGVATQTSSSFGRKKAERYLKKYLEGRAGDPVVDFILEHGQWFKPPPFGGVALNNWKSDPGMREYNEQFDQFRTKVPNDAGFCFENCAKGTAATDLTYVEGFAVTEQMVGTSRKVEPHAWLVTDDGTVYDPTWTTAKAAGRFGLRGTAYFGVPLDKDLVSSEIDIGNTYSHGVFHFRDRIAKRGILRRLKAERRIGKHASPTHPGTGSTQKPHGNWARGGGGPSKPRLSDTVGRGKPHRYKYKSSFSDRAFWETAAISRDTARRRINELKRLVSERYDLPKDMKVEYWLDWEKYRDSVSPSKSSGSYPLARWEPKENRVVISPSIAMGMFDDYPSDWRVVTHELMHATSHIGDEFGLVGPERILEEGMAEIASLKLYADEFDLGEFAEHHRVYPDDGLAAMVSNSAYSEYTTQLLMHAASENGFDREAMWDWMESKWRGGTYDDHISFEVQDRGLNAEQQLAAHIEEVNAQYDDLIERLPQHAVEYEQNRQDMIAHYKEKSSASWEWEATERFKAVARAAEEHGIDLAKIPVTVDDSTWEIQEMEMKASRGTSIPTKEGYELQQTVGRSLLYWFLSDE